MSSEKSFFFLNRYNLLFLFGFNISTGLIAWCVTRYHAMIRDILNSYYRKVSFVYFSFYIYIYIYHSREVISFMHYNTLFKKDCIHFTSKIQTITKCILYESFSSLSGC